jgi:hypothetical protein
MSDEPAAYNLLCSACLTPCPAAEAHVVPRWNPGLRRVITAYRCGNCWVASLVELRSAVASSDAEVRSSFCDFLAGRGETQAAELIRGAPPDEQQAKLFRLIDALEAGEITLDP